MAHLVSITRQGQITIPKVIRKAFGITGATKAVIKKEGDSIVVEPKTDFWSLSGTLRSSISLSDKQLKKARDSFEKQWPKHR
ncbi:MAG TPA: AbrB/MazE/SpoVT family DNA-binding domain-containing protein [Candidatus Paceibacterota bacterium]